MKIGSGEIVAANCEHNKFVLNRKPYNLFHFEF
jgi:hypothetical protein